MHADRRGSTWRRWEPHIHAPGTLLNDQFGSLTTERYIELVSAVEPPIEALGITDYYSLGCYERVLAARTTGSLPHVGLIFPNIELRLSIDTRRGKGINLHLLVSPHDDDHVEHIRRFMSRLTFDLGEDSFQCTEADLVRLGRMHESADLDEARALRAGANQFKVDFRQLKAQYEDSKWMKANTLVAVAGGSTDGTSGLRAKDDAFDAFRREIESFADIIFSANQAQVQFWSGEAGMSLQELDRNYRGPKPCLHGCDAHSEDKIGKPDLDRRTWIKGDLVFESLRQACIEPTSRVEIGPTAPESGAGGRAIRSIRTPDVAWLAGDGVPLNPGLVAIIGARGSGKTALADVIAHGAGSQDPTGNPASFLRRARDLLINAGVELEWDGGRFDTRRFFDRDEPLDPDVHYLSQQFVERLCSTDEGTSDELITEIQKVVFSAHAPAARMEATNFEELLEARVGDTRQQRKHIQGRLDKLSDEILAEKIKREQLPARQKALTDLREATGHLKEARSSLVRKGESERADYYERLRSAVDARAREIQSLDRRRQRLLHLCDAVGEYRSTRFPDLLRDLRNQFDSLELSEDEWKEFAIGFAGDPDAVVLARSSSIEAETTRARAGDSDIAVTSSTAPADLARAPMDSLEAALKEVGDAIGTDRRNSQRLSKLNDQIASNEIKVEKATRELVEVEGSAERLAELVSERERLYAQYFDGVVAEEEALRYLYAPLVEKLAESSETVGKLRLTVIRHVDLDLWAARGESLLDLRKNGAFKGRGSLASYAQEFLLPAWQQGSSADVAAQMAAFRAKYDTAIVGQGAVDRTAPAEEYRRWTLDVGRWLYSTDHIEVRYSFEYENLPLTQLSPGTRGIVLLLLYLALDQEDSRPLIIDQPEENLDPRTVFAELVDLFRAARSRRQVLIVTHNANLVVNTDVDQVVVASCVRGDAGAPPMMSYISGSLENATIRAEVCEILEGGEQAFRERARRLRVSEY